MDMLTESSPANCDLCICVLFPSCRPDPFRLVLPQLPSGDRINEVIEGIQKLVPTSGDAKLWKIFICLSISNLRLCTSADIVHGCRLYVTTIQEAESNLMLRNLVKSGGPPEASEASTKTGVIENTEDVNSESVKNAESLKTATTHLSIPKSMIHAVALAHRMPEMKMKDRPEDMIARLTTLSDVIKAIPSISVASLPGRFLCVRCRSLRVDPWIAHCCGAFLCRPCVMLSKSSCVGCEQTNVPQYAPTRDTVSLRQLYNCLLEKVKSINVGQ